MTAQMLDASSPASAGIAFVPALHALSAPAPRRTVATRQTSLTSRLETGSLLDHRLGSPAPVRWPAIVFALHIVLRGLRAVISVTPDRELPTGPVAPGAGCDGRRHSFLSVGFLFSAPFSRVTSRLRAAIDCACPLKRGDGEAGIPVNVDSVARVIHDDRGLLIVNDEAEPPASGAVLVASLILPPLRSWPGCADGFGALVTGMRLESGTGTVSSQMGPDGVSAAPSRCQHSKRRTRRASGP